MLAGYNFSLLLRWFEWLSRPLFLVPHLACKPDRSKSSAKSP